MPPPPPPLFAAAPDVAHEDAFRDASDVLVGGVNSPVRSFKSVGGIPLFFSKGSGQFLTDIKGDQYLDYVLSWGAMLIGHAHPRVTQALVMAVSQGTSFGTPTLQETEFAQKIRQHVPSLEKIRFVNSGTEAVMSLVRLARGYTKREKIIKFRGCYHGHADSFLVEAGSGALTLGTPSSPGVTAGAIRDSLLADYNDLASVETLCQEYPQGIAAILIEPVPGNMGVLLPDAGFLEGLRRLADEYGALLIFDEVMTGFRVGLGAVQGRVGVRPDLTALGKVIGGGLPAALYGGRAVIMDHVSPLGPIYQAGTLSGNPLAMASGLTTVTILSEQEKELYDHLEATSEKLATGLKQEAAAANVPVVVTRYGAMVTLFFTAAPSVTTFEHVMATDQDQYACFFHEMLRQKIFLPPSSFEAWFLSSCHREEDIETTLCAARVAFARVKTNF